MPEQDTSPPAAGTPGWLRALEIIAGLILVFTSLYVWVYPGVAALTYVFIFGIGLIFLGFARIGAAIFYSAGPGGMRVLAGIIGILCVIIGAYAVASPIVGAATLVYFFAFALMFAGIDRLVLAGSVKEGADTPSWLKYLTIIAGIFALIISFAVILYPGLGLALIFILISLEMFLLGIELIASGVVGKKLIQF